MATVKNIRPIPELTVEDVERFWEKVHKSDKDNGCWEWIGTISPFGYGIFKVRKPRGNVGAHRLSYFLGSGIDPAPLLCCHACDNRRCVRPSHIFLGTHKDNQVDMSKKGRAASGLRHGSVTHPEQLSYGERNTQATLTTDQVIAIRQVYDSGEITNCSAIARRFGISVRNARRIAKRERWRHLP